MMARLDQNIVAFANHNGQHDEDGTFLMDTSTISTLQPSPSWVKWPNVVIVTTNKALTYRGVTFNFDAKGIDETKEKPSTLTSEDGS